MDQFPLLSMGQYPTTSKKTTIQNFQKTLHYAIYCIFVNAAHFINATCCLWIVVLFNFIFHTLHSSIYLKKMNCDANICRFDAPVCETLPALSERCCAGEHTQTYKQPHHILTFNGSVLHYVGSVRYKIRKFCKVKAMASTAGSE